MKYGVARGLFSNEAGMGSTPHAHAVATVSRPEKQGHVAIVSVFFVHLMTVAAFGCLLAGLGVSVPVLTLVAAVTIGNIAGLIPLFPGGIGGRDVVTITILVAGGLAAGDAKTGQLLYTAVVLFFNLFGGLFFLLDPGRRHTEEILKKEMETADE